MAGPNAPQHEKTCEAAITKSERSVGAWRAYEKARNMHNDCYFDFYLLGLAIASKRLGSG
jgi:hypothetical protein